MHLLFKDSFFFVLIVLVHPSFSCTSPKCKDYESCVVPLGTEDTAVFDRVCMHDGTERAWTGKYENQHFQGVGVFHCACCDHPLFPLSTMFDSGTGWPSFYAPFNDDSVSYKEDGYSLAVECGKCGIHLGHIFTDGPSPTYKRYCMNSVCLNFKDGFAPNGTLSSNYFDRLSKYTFFTVRQVLWLVVGCTVLIITIGVCGVILVNRKHIFQKTEVSTYDGTKEENEMMNKNESDSMQDIAPSDAVQSEDEDYEENDIEKRF